MYVVYVWTGGWLISLVLVTSDNKGLLLLLLLYTHIHTYTYTHTHTLTGHFIRYTLLVPGWTHFCLQNCLNSSFLNIPGSSHQKMGTLWSQRDGHGQQLYSGRLWRLNYAQLVLSVPRIYPPHHYTTTTSLNR